MKYLLNSLLIVLIPAIFSCKGPKPSFPQPIVDLTGIPSQYDMKCIYLKDEDNKIDS